MQLQAKKNCRGRPPKFREPRRPVTMTLPERILDRLSQIDKDRSRAVVKVTEVVSMAGNEHLKPVELVEISPGKSLIVVGPCQILRAVPWVKLIEIAPARYLVTIPSGTAIEVLEVALCDLSHNPDLKENEWEGTVLHELLNLIGHQRRARRLSKEEILIADTR